MRKTQVTAYLPNVVGSLAKAAGALAKAKVNIEGISVVENADTGVVRLIVGSAGKAVKALAKAGIAATTQPVEVVAMSDKVGSIAAAAAKLARAGVCINYCYGTTCSCGCDCECRLVISACDLKKAGKLLK